MVLTIRANTHTVMAKGTQISRPVMKYFFKVEGPQGLSRRRNCPFRLGRGVGFQPSGLIWNRCP